MRNRSSCCKIFIRKSFVSDGMCADAAIHDTDGHNPHAHILLTVRPLDEQGKWQYKNREKSIFAPKTVRNEVLPPLNLR